MKSASGLLFGPRRNRADRSKPIRIGRVHHVAFVTKDELYWQAVDYLADNTLVQSADLPVTDNSSLAYQVMCDLQRWGWVEYDQAWVISAAGAKAVAIHRTKQS